MVDSMVVLDEPGQQLEDHMVDLFCGCGGSGGGLLEANELLNRRVKGTFVNHWDKAIKIHSENHPEHRHLEEDLFLLDPMTVFPPGTDCSLLWASPQCTFFSVARGASCVNEQDRSHAHSVTDWVKHLNPESVICENVKEFVGWGPTIQKREVSGPCKGELMWALNAKPVYSAFDKAYPKRKLLPKEHRRLQVGHPNEEESEQEWIDRMVELGYTPYEVPDKSRKGEYFDAWIEEMKELGYLADHKILKSADYGDPTIRQRLFVYFVRKDTGKKIIWPDPYAQDPKKQADDPRPMRWRTARDCIDWTLKGTSVFTRDKKLADNTFRRLAIGLVKYGLKKYLEMGAPDITYHKNGLMVAQERGEFLSPNFGERPTQTPRSHSVDEPTPTVTGHGAGSVVETEAYILPKDGGHKQDYVRSVRHPAGGITTKSHEVLVEPKVECAAIIQMKGQSDAQDPKGPLTAVTSQPSHYVSQPEVTEMIDHQRGTGVCKPVDEPTRATTSGGSHQALAEAFMFAIDQSGGERKNDGTYPVTSPTRTLVTKANQACIEMELEEVTDRFLHACDEKGVDTERATTFLGYLIDELKRRGKVDAKPWIYVYYSSGSEGKAVDEPLPTARTKAGHALVYPVVEMDGKLLKIDLFYRMLTPLELQRAMGFPDDMRWAGCTKTEQIKAIGNSVSHGVARALGLAWYSQDPDVWSKVKHLYEGKAVITNQDN
jgi:DNA (cytosine-5)-methyltransferase 1